MSNQRAKGSRSFLSVLAILFVLGVGAPVAHAVPSLQLDIAGGFYDTTTETILTSSDSFTLYALLRPVAGRTSATDTYYLSVALSPQTSTTASLGSFSVNGTNVNVTSGMTFGNPPIELDGSAGHDGGDLGPHGVFPTYFREFSFTFNSSFTSGLYNTESDRGGIRAGSGLLYAAFQVDRTLLNSPYQLHFDLYNQTFRTNKLTGVVDTDVNKFAPFSHDAGTTTRSVPEPSAVLLMGVGLLGFWLWQRKSRSQSA